MDKRKKGHPMYAGDNLGAEKPDVEESYTSAVGASSLKVEPHRRTAADMVIAAGMSAHRMGLALMRLRTEWDRSAKPVPLAPADIERLASTLPKVPANMPHAGMVAQTIDGKVTHRLPLVVAKEQADAWHEHELKLLLQQLKTLPTVRAGLVHWTQEQGMEEGLHLVVAVLLWWLEPACHACAGTGKHVIAGTGGRSKKACGECRKNPNPGERKVPHGGRGRKLLAYLNDCRRGARVDLDGKFRHQRRRTA